MNTIDDRKASATGEIVGYGSTFGGPPDSYGDIVERGAFVRSLAEWRAQRRMPLLLWMHDITVPAGAWIDMAEDSYGLRAEGRLTMASRQGAEAHALLDDKAIDGLSIGFRIRNARVDEKTGIRYILDMDLYEISIVSFPANERARVEEVRREQTLMQLLEARKQIFRRKATPDSELSAVLSLARARGDLMRAIRC